MTTRCAHPSSALIPCLGALAALLILLPGLRPAAAERLTAPEPQIAQARQSIPWAELGAKGTAQYAGDGLAVFTAPDGLVRLRCALQRLEGEVTREGLWLSSTADRGVGVRFRVVADYVGRNGGAMVALPESGVTGLEQGRGYYKRRGLVEEYSVSADGVRQDFVVAEPPGGAGDLRVELALSGVRAEATAQGARLVMDGSGRRLAYSRLRVMDARARELAARIEVVGDHRLAVAVTDAAAVYPVRIDPTFSDANWISMGGFAGVCGVVYAAAVDAAGNLYVGGTFTACSAMGGYVAKWDGTAWSVLGPGTAGFVYALAVSGTNLYAGGSSATGGGTNISQVAKWNGSAWLVLGSTMNEQVRALAVSGTDLYAGGLFTVVGGVSAKYIAKWDGSGWSALDSGMNGVVNALVVSGGDLYAGGGFTKAGGVTANYVAKWSGGAWSALGSGMSYRVRALAVSGANLYAGGDFTIAGGVGASGIARWDGTTWSALGPGTDRSVLALAVSGTDLYAGGEFSTAGGESANYIAKWNGAAWCPLGSGTDNYVYALAASGTDLYAGGQFRKAGGKVCTLVAKALKLGLVATNTTYSRVPGVSLKIRIADIAWDVNGNPITVQSLGGSAQGATLSHNGSYIYYLPANNSNDSFTYTVSNGSGSASGAITVNVMSGSSGIAKLMTVSGGTATIRFFGIPGIEYDVQRTTSLVEPVSWTLLTSSPLAPGADNSFSYTDSSAPDGTAYYRSLQH